MRLHGWWVTLVEERVGAILLAGGVLDFEQLLVVMLQRPDQLQLLLGKGQFLLGGG